MTSLDLPPCPQLETSSHILHFYPSNDKPYYALAEKSHRTFYTPLPLTPECQLAIDPVPSTDGEHHFLAIRLKGILIGAINSAKDSEIDQLAQFTAQWRDALSSLAENLDQTTQQLPPNFNPMTAVTQGLTALPKLFTAPPLATPATVTPSLKSIKSAKSRPTSVIYATPPSPVSQSSAPTMHIVDQIYAHKDEFLVEKLLRVRLVSWNVHGEPIQSVNVSALLGLPVLYDIYVVALQESDLLGPKNLYANTVTLQNTKDAIIATLGGPDSFQVVSHNQLLGMMLILVAATPIAPQLSNARISTTGTGLFGMWGNKGAASIKVTLGADPSVGVVGTDMVFVNCHLAAGEGKPGVERRKWEFSEIEKKLNVPGLIGTNPLPEILFSGEDVIVDEISDDLPPSGADISGTVDQSLAFVLGDLNYRVALDPDVVLEFLDRKDFDTIFNHDQLLQQIRERKILTGFREMPITFLPTYKYAVGTDDFDDNKPGNNDKARAPSYTDRIFSKPSASLYQTEYGSLMEYTISDHKPVFATYELTAHLIDSAKRKKVVDRVLRQSDTIENSARPNVVISPTELLVNDAIVLRKSQGHVVIEQGGLSSRVVEWEIDMKNPTIVVSPRHGHLPVGAKQYIHFSCTLPIKAHSGSSLVQEVAILRIIDAQDIFIPVEFKAVPTCLGASLDLLSRMPNGARSGEIMSTSSTNMPREIWNCIDYLWAYVVGGSASGGKDGEVGSAGAAVVTIVSDMFDETVAAQKSEPSIENQVQDWMDTGEEFDHEVLNAANSVQENSGVYSVANQFMMLLKHLDGGIVPAEYYSVVLSGKEGATMVRFD